MKITVNELRNRVDETVKKYENRRARIDALKKIQYVLVANDWPISDSNGALIFDGRDNEEMKVRYYTAVLKTPITIQLVESIAVCPTCGRTC